MQFSRVRAMRKQLAVATTADFCESFVVLAVNAREICCYKSIQVSVNDINVLLNCIIANCWILVVQCFTSGLDV